MESVPDLKNAILGTQNDLRGAQKIARVPSGPESGLLRVPLQRFDTFLEVTLDFQPQPQPRGEQKLTHTPLPSSLGVGGFERAAPSAADPEKTKRRIRIRTLIK